MAFSHTVEGDDRFAFLVLNRGKPKAFAWVWMERLEAKKPRVPKTEVIADRVANHAEKECSSPSDSDPKFFTEPHYNGFPAAPRPAAGDR